MVYTHQDIQGFDKSIKKLLDKGLIRNSKSLMDDFPAVVYYLTIAFIMALAKNIFHTNIITKYSFSVMA